MTAGRIVWSMVLLVLLTAGCASQAPVPEGATPGAASHSVAGAPASSRARIEACGARFDVPAGWRPRQLEPGHWQLTDGQEQGFVASMRCLPSVPYPRGRWDEVAEVAEALDLDGAGQPPSQDQLRYLSWIEGRRDAVPGPGPNLIALRREAADAHPHGLHRQVALWPVADGCDRVEPCAGLLSLRWSSDVPVQQAGYEALSAALAETLKLPESHH